MKMELTGLGFIMLITLAEYILYPASARELFCGNAEAIPWTKRLREKYNNSVYWRKKFCQGHHADVKFAHDDLKNSLSRIRMVENGSDFDYFTYTVYNSRVIELLRSKVWVDEKRVIFQNDGRQEIATVIKDNDGNSRPGAVLKIMSRVISYCIIDDQPDYRIIMNWYKDYAMVEITDDLMQRYVNTSANPLQNYEHKIANVLAQQGFDGTCINAVLNKFPFDFWIGDMDYFTAY